MRIYTLADQRYKRCCQPPNGRSGALVPHPQGNGFRVADGPTDGESTDPEWERWTKKEKIFRTVPIASYFAMTKRRFASSDSIATTLTCSTILAISSMATALSSVVAAASPASFAVSSTRRVTS